MGLGSGADHGVRDVGNLSYGAHACCLMFVGLVCFVSCVVGSRGGLLGREKEVGDEGKAWACFELVVGGTRTLRACEPVVVCCL